MIAPGLHAQMLRLLDGELGESELQALEEEIMGNPEALKAWRLLCCIHSELESLHAAQVQVRNAPVVPIQRILARQRRRFVRVSLMAAAALILISGIALWMGSAAGTRPFSASFQVAPDSSFTVTDSHGKPSQGGELAAGSEIRIFHGAAEILLPNKVRAVAEAPASLRVLDDHTLRMDHGRAFFRVGSVEGRGFTVVTPSQRIVDLGTAFGLEVSKGKETGLHVFEGSVRIDGADGEAGEVVASGKSVRIKGSEIAGKIDGSPPFFLKELPEKVETVLLEDFESGLVAGREYVVQVDPAAIVDLAGNAFPGIGDKTTWNFRSASPSVRVPVVSYRYDGGEPGSQPSSYVPPHKRAGLFLDAANAKLTDGNLGGANGWPSGTYVGFLGESAGAKGQVTFDLGSIREIQEISFTTHLLTSGRVKAVKAAASRDGVSFDPPVTLEPEFSGVGILTGKLDLSQLDPARFYRLSFMSPYQWIFLGEVDFTAAAAPAAPDIIPPDDEDAADDPGLDAAGNAPPALLSVSPRDGAEDAPPGSALTMVFDKPVKFGRGRVILRNVTDWSEQEIVVGGSRTSVKGNVVRILPRTDLEDGITQPGMVAGWESKLWVSLINPRGDGKWYSESNLAAHNRGVTGSMLGPTMITMGPHHRDSGIRREFTEISPGSLYTVSVAVGVRDAEAEDGNHFLGYSVRLVSGETLLAETISESPPGAPNTVTSVGLSWDSTLLPPGIRPGDPLSIEIRPASGSEPGYLDIDHVRVTVVEKPGA